MDFKNTIIILTSNLGSQFLLEGISPDGDITPEAREQVEALLRRSFRPEFLNRLDEIVVLQASDQGEYHRHHRSANCRSEPAAQGEAAQLPRQRRGQALYH